MLNKKQALELFEREAVCFGEEDGIPLPRMCQLFDYEAIAYIVAKPDNTVFQTLYINSHQFFVVTLRGFLRAVSYANVQEYEQLKKKMGKVIPFPRHLSPSPETRKTAQS